jgi:CHAD domain-containing protein
MTTTLRPIRRARARPAADVSLVIEKSLKNAADRLHEARQGDLSSKSLHELRIACRRAEAALRLCQEAAESRVGRWLMRELETFRRACNQARDDDVLLKWVRRRESASNKSLRLLRQAILAHREEVRPTIVKLARKLSGHGGFKRRSEEVVKQLRACERDEPIAQAFGRHLFDEINRFVRAFPTPRHEDFALHRLRIVGKRLRYASELVTEIWPEVELTELNEHLHSLQDQLGAIHDQIVGERRLRKPFTKGSGHSAQRLAQEARSTAVRLQRKFWRWWQACPLERMLADTTAEVLTLMRRKS